MHSTKLLWDIVPVSDDQKRDVRASDLLNDGLYRKCSTYRGGGGYDQFPIIANKRLNKQYSEQFIVQLKRCVLDCHYCYVTRKGVWGDSVKRTSEQMVNDFIESKQQTFHLMGGAPAIYIDHWDEIIDLLAAQAPNAVFHSDLMLVESEYSITTLKKISKPNTLYAVNIKGVNDADWTQKTRKPFNEKLFWTNLKRLYELNVPCYLTFTGASKDKTEEFFQEVSKRLGKSIADWLQRDFYTINLIDYNATSYVDNQAWGVMPIVKQAKMFADIMHRALTVCRDAGIRKHNKGELSFANQPMREHIEHLEGHLQNLKDGIARNESSISEEVLHILYRAGLIALTWAIDNCLSAEELFTSPQRP
ncbi:MAG: radical SAM protein, partial [Cyanobacteria bacterium J06628_3]